MNCASPGGTETAAAQHVEHLALVHGTVVVEVDGSSGPAPGDCLVFAADRRTATAIRGRAGGAALDDDLCPCRVVHT
jgi:hypothetical protein